MTFSSDFWTQKYERGDMGWDMGYPSPPLTSYFDQLRNLQLSILIPGCGNAYEAGYLLEQGFYDVHVLDISPYPLNDIAAYFYPEYDDRLHLHQVDFFEHAGQYDLIVEQTFFCALSPDYREAYVRHMYELLKPGGTLAGVLFTFPLDDKGPPFGGSIEEYQALFSKHFKVKTLEPCYNSIKPRLGSECFINLVKPHYPVGD
jgi:SAM-dependent methyltransferase